MMAFLDFVSRGIVVPAFIAALFGAPCLIVVSILLKKRRVYKDAAIEPFTQLPLRPPGESLRLRIDQLSEKIGDHLFILGAVAIGGSVGTLTAPAASRVSFGTVFLTAAVAIAIWAGKKVLPLADELWNCRLGFTGERVVGEELNQLLALGFRVFHDVPFEGFNIDHVLVGPPGVYAVETKAWRKPADVKGLARAQLYSDGVRIRLPRSFDTEAIPQARRNAQALAKWLTSATGELVVVNAILTFPGWAVNREKACDVNVLRPDEIKRSFPSHPTQSLSDAQIQRIAHQLTERCRLAATGS